MEGIRPRTASAIFKGSLNTHDPSFSQLLWRINKAPWHHTLRAHLQLRRAIQTDGVGVRS